MLLSPLLKLNLEIPEKRAKKICQFHQWLQITLFRHLLFLFQPYPRGRLKSGIIPGPRAEPLSLATVYLPTNLLVDNAEGQQRLARCKSRLKHCRIEHRNAACNRHVVVVMWHIVNMKLFQFHHHFPPYPHCVYVQGTVCSFSSPCGMVPSPPQSYLSLEMDGEPDALWGMIGWHRRRRHTE